MDDLTDLTAAEFEAHCHQVGMLKSCWHQFRTADLLGAFDQLCDAMRFCRRRGWSQEVAHWLTEAIREELNRRAESNPNNPTEPEAASLPWDFQYVDYAAAALLFTQLASEAVPWRVGLLYDEVRHDVMTRLHVELQANKHLRNQ